MKRCTTCKEEKALDQFSKQKGNKDGLRYQCKSCINIAAASYREKPEAKQRKAELNKAQKIRRKKDFFEFMQDKKCIKCGESDIACLQFDHRDGTNKRANVSRLIANSHSWATVQEEIDKCDILCANCHARRTAIQFNWYK